MRPGQDKDSHDVIADRYERRPTIITSNLDFSEWNDAFHNYFQPDHHIQLAEFLSVQSRPSAPLKGSTSIVQWTGQWTVWTGKMKFEILGLESCLRRSSIAREGTSLASLTNVNFSTMYDIMIITGNQYGVLL
jgi:hypothetical protein